MKLDRGEGSPSSDPQRVELLALLRDQAAGQAWSSPRPHKVRQPPTDVYETEDHIVVKVEVAGMKAEDFEISLEARRLTISGVRHDPSAKLGYQQMEIQYGSFEAHVHLPKPVEEDDIEATYKGGFLVVRMPKAKPRQVPVTNT
jgi:HSP20 family protein